jgi:hypothetical protein
LIDGEPLRSLGERFADCRLFAKHVRPQSGPLLSRFAKAALAGDGLMPGRSAMPPAVTNQALDPGEAVSTSSKYLKFHLFFQFRSTFSLVLGFGQ